MNRAEQQEVSSRRESEATSAALHHSPSLALPPELSSPLPMEKLSSTKPVPGAKNVGTAALKGQFRNCMQFSLRINLIPHESSQISPM